MTSERPDEPRYAPLRPGQVLRLILPSYIGSTLLAVAGVALVFTGHRTTGLVLVAIAAVGGLAMRMVLMYRAQMRGRPPGP